MNSFRSVRENQRMQSLLNPTQGEDAFFTVIAACIPPDDRGIPFECFGQLEAQAAPGDVTQVFFGS